MIIENGVVILLMLILLVLIAIIVIILVLDATNVRKVDFSLLKIFSVKVEK